MHKLVVYSYESESVVYNKESGDMHLMPSFHAELLQTLTKEIDKSITVSTIIEEYSVSEVDASHYLSDLIDEFHQLNLLD